MTLEELLAALQALVDQASADGRDLTEEEAARAVDLGNQITRARALRGALTRSQPGVARRMHATFRAEVEATGKVLRGHAAVFGQVAEIFPGYGEELASSAFDDVLKRDGLDVRALFNHDPSLLLGRTASGTLRIGVDSTGLEFENDLPNTTLGNDVRELVDRGDITGASFGFMPGDVDLSRAADGAELCTHTSISDLLDVSPVTFPAYGGTDVALRARNAGPAPAPAKQLPVRLIRARALLLIGATK